MPAAKSADPDTDVWKKAIVNAGINPLGALLNVPNGMIVKNEHSLALMRSIIAEAVTAANAHGLRLDASEMQLAAVAICEQTAANECSMLQDVKNKRRTEIESITGEIIAAAKKHNIETPSNTGVYQLIKALESGYLMH
jgi:2-dehydropantoate 2-reductase